MSRICNAVVLDADSRVWMFMMHGGGGGGCPEYFILVFFRWQCGPGLPFEAIGPKGSYFFSRLSITIFLRKHMTTCDLPGGMQTLYSHPRDTHMRCLANNLNSVARSVAYLLNMQADRRSHPA